VSKTNSKKQDTVDLKKQVPKVYGKITNGDLLVEGGIPRTRKKVAIVGFAPTSMRDVQAFFNDPDMEIWGLNQLYLAFPEIVGYATRWFQIHSRVSYDNAIRDIKHHEWLSKQVKFPIYMQTKEPDIPMSIPFPVKEIGEAFPRKYFTNSISWEIALAIYEGFEDIHIYGVDMAQEDEYSEQRPSVEYFIGIADGKGINLYVSPVCDLCKTVWQYPFEDDAPFRIKVDGRRKELRERVGQLAAQEQGMHDQRMQLLGALENMNYIQKTWSNSIREQTPGQIIQKR